MKKTILSILLICCCFFLFGCEKECEHQYAEKVTEEPTCVKEGVRTFTCNLCDDSYTEEIPMLQHNYSSEVTKEPSCSQKGTTTFTCSLCNDSYTEDIKTIAHTLTDSVVTKEPSCTEEGEKVAVCKVCGAKGITQNIAKIAHNFTAKVTQEPTCTATGVKTLTCSGCGETEMEGIPKIDHNYTSKITQQPTCTVTGVKTLTCSGCGHTKTESIGAHGHDYGQYAIDSATCTADGVSYMKCTRCGDEYSEKIKATGHYWVEATCTEAKHCTQCSISDGSELGHTTDEGTCSRCGQTFSVADKCVLIAKNIPCYLTLQMYNNPSAPVIRMQITDMQYSFAAQGDGKVKLILNFDVYISSAGFSTASFYVRVYDSQGRLIKNEHVYTEDTASGLYTTADATIRNLAPDTYTIELVAK